MGPLLVTVLAEEPGGIELGSIDISLDLDESDRRDGQRAVPVSDAVARVFPTMIRHALVGLGLVVGETVAIMVGVPIDPAQSRVDVPVEPLPDVQITGPPNVLGQQHDKQWRGIDRSVVRRLWDLLQIGHFPDSEFVENLARLLIAPAMIVLALVICQQDQRVGGNGRVVEERLERRDD